VSTSARSAGGGTSHEAGTTRRVTAISARIARALGLVSSLAREGAAILYEFESDRLVSPRAPPRGASEIMAG
jgi:hypothetical protein